MIGSVTRGVGLVQGYQALKQRNAASPQAQASQLAQQSLSNELESKIKQKEQKDLLLKFQSMSREERAEFLKQSQQYQAQQKRGGN